jgi:curved DNA-binding protein CbpA
MFYSRSSGSSREERTPQSEALPPNPYSALGVPENADTSAIRNAYRRLVLTYHPDRVNDPSKKALSAERFLQIQEAYELLTDEARLAEYKERVLDNQNSPRSTQSTNREHARSTHRSTHGESSRPSNRHHARSTHGESSRSSNKHHARSTHGEGTRSTHGEGTRFTRGESSRSSNRHHARPTSGEYRTSSRSRSPNREYQSYEEPNSSSGSRYPNMVEFPLRPFYPRCAVCGDKGCVHEHRWYTRLGYINDMTSRGVSMSGARRIAEERFGVWDDYEICEACFKRGCTHPHRIFTREGFVWEQLAIQGDDSTDSIVSARIRAREEYGEPSFSPSYGTHRRSRSSSGVGSFYDPLQPPFTSTFSYTSSYSRRPLGSPWRDNTYDSVSYADELRRRRYLDEDRYGVVYRTYEWRFI